VRRLEGCIISQATRDFHWRSKKKTLPNNQGVAVQPTKWFLLLQLF
jgi:hypothetical protein